MRTISSPKYAALALAAALAAPLACTSILGDFAVNPSAGAGGHGGASSSSSSASSTSTSTSTSSSSTSSTSSTSSGQGGGDASAPPSAECVAYCDLVTTNCFGTFQQYTTNDDCLAVCKYMPTMVPDAGAGGSGPDGGMADTLGCHTVYAMGTAGDHGFCTLAGPAGNGGCATPNDAYCDLEMTVCPGIFKTRDDCVMALGSIPQMPLYDTKQTAGNSLGCRMYWLTQAAADATLCPKTGLTSDVCACSESNDCSICIQCTLGLSGKCRDLLFTCQMDLPCNDCSNCSQGCGGDQACITACDAANPAGCTKYGTLLNCIYCDQCKPNGLCATDQMGLGWVCK